MSFRAVFDVALSILGEDVSGNYCEDYRSRAPYLLALICCTVAPADLAYREANSLPSQGVIPDERAELDEEFPFCPAFRAICSYYLASLLVFDTNGELSDRLYERYFEMLSRVMSGLPASSLSIVDVYS